MLECRKRLQHLQIFGDLNVFLYMISVLRNFDIGWKFRRKEDPKIQTQSYTLLGEEIRIKFNQENEQTYIDSDYLHLC
jgi:hypothetical protein